MLLTTLGLRPRHLWRYTKSQGQKTNLFLETKLRKNPVFRMRYTRAQAKADRIRDRRRYQHRFFQTRASSNHKHPSTGPTQYHRHYQKPYLLHSVFTLATSGKYHRTPWHGQGLRSCFKNHYRNRSYRQEPMLCQSVVAERRRQDGRAAQHRWWLTMDCKST